MRNQHKCHSAYTPHKQHNLNKIIGHLAGIWNNQPWANPVFIDCMAGDGKWDRDSEPSPFCINRHAKFCGADGYLIEINPDSAASLKKALGHERGLFVKVVTGCAVDVIKTIDASKYTGGVAYIDPNGVIPRMDELAEQLSRFQRMDIIVSIAAANCKRYDAVHGTPATLRNTRAVREAFQKPHWYVRKKARKQQWTLLLGTETDAVREMKNIAFVRASSEIGKSYIAELDYTANELQNLSGIPKPSDLPGFG